MHVPWFIVAGVLAGTAPPVASAPAVSAVRAGWRLTVSEQQLQQLLAELGHPRFAVREAATKRLSKLDSRHLPALVERYRSSGSYEMKRRIRCIIESMFYLDQIRGREGFLGIEILQQVLPGLTDPVTGQATQGVVVRAVKQGLAGARAGMQDHDIVVSFDRRPIPGDPTPAGFVKMVSLHPPRSSVELCVLRPAKVPGTVTLTIKGNPAEALEGARLEPLPAGLTLKGIRVVTVVPGSPASALELRPNQIIHALGGRELAGPGGLRILRNAVSSAQPGDTLGLAVSELCVVWLKVTLGARPPEFTTAADKAEAQARFLTWWQDQGGELLLRSPDSRPDAVSAQPPAPANPVAEAPSIIP